jgi:hypothetical protein
MKRSAHHRTDDATLVRSSGQKKQSINGFKRYAPTQKIHGNDTIENPTNSGDHAFRSGAKHFWTSSLHNYETRLAVAETNGSPTLEHPRVTQCPTLGWHGCQGEHHPLERTDRKQSQFRSHTSTSSYRHRRSIRHLLTLDSNNLAATLLADIDLYSARGRIKRYIRQLSGEDYACSVWATKWTSWRPA